MVIVAMRRFSYAKFGYVIYVSRPEIVCASNFIVVSIFSPTKGLAK